MKVPILLYIDHEEVGQVESITLNVEPDVGVVISITREARVGTEEISEEEDSGQAPPSEDELIGQALEQTAARSVDAHLSSIVPSSGGVLAMGEIGVEKINFSDVDTLELQKVSLLRIHPMFFSAHPVVKEPPPPPTEFTAPVEAYPELKRPEDEVSSPYEIQPGQYKEDTHKFEDVELSTSEPVYFMSGIETSEQISQLAQAEGMLIDKYEAALGFEEIERPYYYFSPDYTEPETCTLHSVIRVWLSTLGGRGA